MTAADPTSFLSVVWPFEPHRKGANLQSQPAFPAEGRRVGFTRPVAAGKLAARNKAPCPAEAVGHHQACGSGEMARRGAYVQLRSLPPAIASTRS